MDKLGQGNVTITLADGETIELKPTISAVQAISQKYGSLSDAVERCSKLDFNLITDVVVLGTAPRYNSPKNRQQLIEKIFAAGLTDDTGGIAERCVSYIFSLMRGGKPPSAEAESEADGADLGNSNRSS